MARLLVICFVGGASRSPERGSGLEFAPFLFTSGHFQFSTDTNFINKGGDMGEREPWESKERDNDDPFTGHEQEDDDYRSSHSADNNTSDNDD